MKCKVVCFLSILLTLARINRAENNTALPANPKCNKAKIIGQELDATTTIEVTGFIYNKNGTLPAFGVPPTLKLVVTKAHQVGSRSAYIVKTDNKRLRWEASQLTTSITTPNPPILNKLPTSKRSPHALKVADFTLYITIRSYGQIMHSERKGTYFKQQSRQYSGMAKVVYARTFLKYSYERFYGVLDAFTPLAKSLECDAIWVKAAPRDNLAKSRLGVAWGSGKGWCQVVP